MSSGKSSNPPDGGRAGTDDTRARGLAPEREPKRPRERARKFTTVSGFPVRQLYTQDDLAGHDAARDIGEPGEAPYTRGIHPAMYRDRLWTMRQFAGFGSAED